MTPKHPLHLRRLTVLQDGTPKEHFEANCSLTSGQRERCHERRIARGRSTLHATQMGCERPVTGHGARNGTLSCNAHRGAQRPHAKLRAFSPRRSTLGTFIELCVTVLGFSVNRFCGPAFLQLCCAREDAPALVERR